MIGLALTGLVLNIFIPSQACLPMAVLAYGICRSLNLGVSKASTGIMLSAAAGALLPLMFMYSPSVAVIYTAGMTVTGKAIPSYLAFLQQNIVSVVFLILMVFIYSKMFKPNHTIDGKEYFQDKYAELGAMKLSERKCSKSKFWHFIICGRLYSYRKRSRRIRYRTNHCYNGATHCI